LPRTPTPNTGAGGPTFLGNVQRQFAFGGKRIIGGRRLNGICGMGDGYELQVLERPDGRWNYRLVVIGADDPSTWESDGKSYLGREDAERAGRLAIAAKLLRSGG